MALNVPSNIQRSILAPVLNRPSMRLTISNLPLNTEGLNFLISLSAVLSSTLSQLPSLRLLQGFIKSTNHWGCPFPSRTEALSILEAFSVLFPGFRTGSIRTYHKTGLLCLIVCVLMLHSEEPSEPEFSSRAEGVSHLESTLNPPLIFLLCQ